MTDTNNHPQPDNPHEPRDPDPDRDTDQDREPPVPPRRPLRAYLRYFLGLGTWGFGGPIATVGYMQRDLVERRRWIDRSQFLNGVALGQTMPGPLAAQVTMWVGFLQRGPLGAFAVAAAFILPSFLVVLAVAIVYVRYQGLDWVQALFYGIAPGVIAIIALAAVKLARLTNGGDRRLWAISVIMGAVTAITGAEIAVLFIAAGLLMVAIDAPPRRPNWLRWPRTLNTVGPCWLAAQGPWIELSAAASTHAALAGFFLKAGAFIFGSGLAIVPFLRDGVVGDHHWMTEAQFLDAVAMGLITPGPVVITATFIGYYVGGLVGAVVATVAIFVPIYLGVVVPGPWFIRHRHNPHLQAFVKGATAAAAGAIAGAVIVLAQDAIIDIPTSAIALAALVLLWRYKTNEPYIVGLTALAGLALH